MHECVACLCCLLMFIITSCGSSDSWDAWESRGKSFPRQHLLSDLTVKLISYRQQPLKVDTEYTAWTNKSDFITCKMLVLSIASENQIWFSVKWSTICVCVCIYSMYIYITYIISPLTLICYSCDGVSVQHPIQKWIWSLGYLKWNRCQDGRVEQWKQMRRTEW